MLQQIAKVYGKTKLWYKKIAYIKGSLMEGKWLCKKDIVNHGENPTFKKTQKPDNPMRLWTTGCNKANKILPRFYKIQ